MTTDREIVVDSFAGGELAEATTTRVCPHCSQAFIRVPRRRYCTNACRVAASARRHNQSPERACRVCNTVFVRVGRGQSNKWYCSDECAAAGARRSRAEFKRRRPDRERLYRERTRAKRRRDTALERLWRKYPWMPRACEACGESRVLDVAHRPEHRRNGAWPLAANKTPEKVWVLCPLCHALLDRLGYTAEQLGIKPRVTLEQA